MGAGKKAPEYAGLDLNSLPGGNELYESIMKQRREGLDKNVSDIYTKQGKAVIGSNLAEGNQSLKESIARSGGNVPIDALIRGQVGLQSSANKSIADLTDKLGMANYGAKQDALGQYGGLMQLLGQQQQSKNAYIQSSSDRTDANKFDAGGLLGGLIGAGGNIAGGGISRKGTTVKPK